ncbi:MAG: AAA family ATPase, partial [Actinomycetota bacterium]|nr:AAA family ATPase [Actinomycetota bacterium]
MEFRILGPLEVVADGKVLDLGGQKQRALLAALLLEGNRVVSSDRLIEALWEENPPETAQKALQVYVSQLRKLLGRERLETKARGYRLRVERDELDADRFRRLLDEGRLEDASALWRGPPLADFAYERFAEAEIEHLEELRLASLEQRIERDLGEGRHAELVGELEALVRQHPLRERLRGALMVALYRSGRQAEALEGYQAARTTLVEELGIEPGRKLRELHHAILTQDPSLDLVSGSEEAEKGRGSRGAFVGREAELGELLAALEGALAGRAHLVLLAGEPGIGKSRLADEVADRATERGARVLVGRCWEAGGAPAFWPWVQVVRSYIGETDTEALRAQLGAAATEIARIVPELRQLLPDVPPPPSLDPEAARFRLFDSLTTFLKNAAAVRPLVILLDDLHAADEPTLLLLRFVTRELGESGVLVIAAYRVVDPILADPLATALTELTREPVTRIVPVRGLDERNVARFVELASGEAAPGELVATIHEETEGNPLFVGEIVRLLLAEGRLEASAAGEFAIPESVKDVIGRRLRHLSSDCNRILAVASVLGREFDLDLLASVSAVAPDTLLPLLDEAITARVAADAPGANGRLRFAHALIRDTVYEAMTSIRRAQLHRQVGEALEELHAQDPGPHLAELAHHFFRAAPGGDAEKAVAYARRAGDRALALLAYEEAARLYRMALERTKDRGSTRCDLLLALGEAQARAGDTPAAKATFREAADLAASNGLADQLARAALGYGGRFLWDVSRDDPHLASLLERALASLDGEDSALRVRLLARLAGGPLRDATADAERRRSLGGQALQMARRIGEPSTLAYALLGYMASHHSPDFVREQAEMASELVDVALQAGDLERALEGYDSRFVSELEFGDVAPARADLDAMAALADELRQPAQRWLVAVYRALLALLEGRLEDAERLIIETRELGERAQDWDAAVVHGLQLYFLRREQGRLAEVEELVRRAAKENPTYPIARCVLASMLAELGSAAEASEELEALAADRFRRLPFDEEWEVSMCLLAETAAKLGDCSRAATLYELLLPYAARVAISYPEISLGPVARFLGVLAAATGRS